MVAVVVFLGSILGVLQTSTAQNYLTKKTLGWVSNQTSHDITIENARIAWFDKIELSGVLVKDFAGDSLASAQTMILNYDLSQFISEKVMELEKINLESGQLNVNKYADSTELNLNFFLKALRKITNRDSNKVKSTVVDQITLKNFVFRLNDERKEERLDKIDFYHLNLAIKHAEFLNVTIKKDSIGLDIVQFVASDSRNRIAIEKINSKVGYTNTSLIFDNLTLKTEYSIIRDSIHLAYEDPTDLSSFSTRVDLFINVVNSTIHPNDARAILGHAILKRPVNVSFEMEGRINDLRINDLNLTHGQSQIQSTISLIGLPVVTETFMDASIAKAKIYASDIELYVEKKDNFLDGFEFIEMESVFSGFVNNFSTKASVITSLGKVKADLNVTISEDKNQTSYTGHFDLLDFHIGKLVGDTAMFQEMSIKGRVLGKGIEVEGATFLVDMTATNVGLKNYSYDSLAFKGYLSSNHFFGHFNIDDPNCKVSGRANIDLRKTPNKLSITSTIDTLFTKRLNLTSEDFFLQTKLDWNQTHLKLDSLVGMLKFSETVLKRDDTRSLELAEVQIETQLDSIERRISLNAPGVEAKLYGNFTFKSLVGFFTREYADLSGYLEFNDDTIAYDVVPLKAELETKLGDVNGYINFFKPNVSISKGAILEITFEQKKYSDAIVSVFAQVDSIRFNEDVYIKNEMDLYASLNPTSDDVLASFLFSSQDQHWGVIPSSKGFMAEGIWSDDKIEFTTVIEHTDTNTKTKINSEISLSTDSIEFRFKPSEVIALGNRWKINPQNHIWISKEGVFFESMEIDSGEKSVALSGLLSNTRYTHVNVVAKNIDLQKFNSVLKFPMQGVLDADFSFYRRPGKPFQFEGNFNLNDFLYEEVEIGNINGISYWNEEVEGVRTRIFVDRENFKTIEIGGYYYPLKKEQFDFDISFDQINFKVLEAFTSEVLSEVRGSASGEVTFTGTLEKPILTGVCEIEDGGFKVNYLQTDYDFGGKVLFEKNKIDFKDFLLRDADGDSASITGDVKHDYFSEMTADLKVKANDFSFLNTTSSDNDLYYGSAVASGDIFITGPINDLQLKVNAKTEKGTRFFIPLEDSEDYEQAAFISFIDLSDTIKADKDIITQIKRNLGLTIDFDLEVTPDAYVELIFDIKTGDIIRGRGNSNLKLKLDKNGNLELYGSLTISEGAYNFTAPNLNFINKEFQIVPGGTIVWYGDPYAGRLDLTATYVQKASFDNLIGDSDAQEDDLISKKYPVMVVLKLKGDMLSPDIEFDITLDESVGFGQNQEVTKLLAQVKSDEQQLKKQVVSLLFLKRFSLLQSSFIGVGSGNGGLPGSGDLIEKNLSEFLSNQISYLATQLDENLEVEIDLNTLDQEGVNTFQLRLAYTFLDGRLKVTRGGTQGAASRNQISVNDIIGDFSVEYTLTKDGKLRAKMFTQTDQNLLSSDGQQRIETGLSLRYIKSFNIFKGILKKISISGYPTKRRRERIIEKKLNFLLNYQ